MAGQQKWDNHGAPTNAYVVMPEIVRSLYYTALRKTLFGLLNLGRSVKTTSIIHGGNTLHIDSGNESPVWEKQLSENNTARFTMREENKGMATYGDTDVAAGDFAQYMHLECHAWSIDTPAYPIVGYESKENIKRVINDLVAVEKENIATWIAKEMDFDAFRALLMGASRGLLDTAYGGKGIKLYGATTGGEHRSNWNAFAPSGSSGGHLAGLSAQSTVPATHNAAVGSLITGIPAAGSDNSRFTYMTHKDISAIVDDLQLQEVTVNGRTYRAVAITDIRNIYTLRDDPNLVQLWTNATPRADDNLALYSRDTLILDDILYIPTHQLKYFRPTVVGGVPVYGAGMTQDPRTNPANSSNVTMTLVLGRGSMVRARRKGEIRFTDEVGRHGKGAEYAAHYDDGWMRREWGTRDDRTAKMFNDSSFIVFNRDNGGVGR
jgi:hypothetical protein